MCKRGLDVEYMDKMDSTEIRIPGGAVTVVVVLWFVVLGSGFRWFALQI